MSGLTRDNRTMLWLFGLVLALPVGTYSVTQPDSTAADAEAFASRFLAVAYPGLPAPQIVGTGRAGLASFDVTYSENDAQPAASEDYLAGNVRFEHSRISEISMHGRFVSTPMTDEIYRLQSTGRIQDIATLEAELQSRGARFPPSARAEFVAVLDVERFAPVLGALIGEPEVLAPWDRGTDGPVKWIVNLRTLEPTGQRMCYGLFFEVFNGRLAGVLAMPMGSFPGAKPDECWPGK